jgi:hypothetical protein
MGVKTQVKNKALENPGAGEYETDIAPITNTNLSHVIGTGSRSDLGVGKAYLYPGPGHYSPTSRNDGTRVR